MRTDTRYGAGTGGGGLLLSPVLILRRCWILRRSGGARVGQSHVRAVRGYPQSSDYLATSLRSTQKFYQYYNHVRLSAKILKG